MSIHTTNSDDIGLPVEERSVYTNLVLANGGILARDRWGLLAFVSPHHQWSLPSPEH